VVTALVLVPSGHASHLSMDMPGLAGAVVPPASLALLATTAIAAVLQGLWLFGSARFLRRRPRAADLGWPLTLAPLAVPAARVALIRGPASTASVGIADQVVAVGSAGSEHMWALLSVLALAVGFAAARALAASIEWRASESPERAPFERALGVLVLTWPLVGLILATSTGIDCISSWIRWGGCGLAAIVCAASALVPAGPLDASVASARVVGGVTFVFAVAFSLLAEREYVEALGHDALAHRDPFDPAVGWARGLTEIAAAVEPRERYGLLLALLPWIALAPGLAWRRELPQLASGLLVLGMGIGLAAVISSGLDQAAVLAAGNPSVAPQEEPAEILWSSRALPRSTSWLRAMVKRGRV
jgi:hypothetical protein